jgi:hypothetical protein
MGQREYIANQTKYTISWGATSCLNYSINQLSCILHGVCVIQTNNKHCSGRGRESPRIALHKQLKYNYGQFRVNSDPYTLLLTITACYYHMIISQHKY